MASGLSEHEARAYCLKPDQFLRKAFTAEQFGREVLRLLGMGPKSVRRNAIDWNPVLYQGSHPCSN
jgi:hypothetical protein